MNLPLQHARTFLGLLARPGEVYELRALTKGRGNAPIVTSGYFDDLDAMAEAAIGLSGKADGIYCTINPTNPALLARAPANRVRQAGNGDTTSDRDVVARRHLLIDVDPVRPAGISSDDAEHQASLDLAQRIAEDLSAIGWPDPIRADSGNGAHLIYAVDLPTVDGDLVKRVLAALSKKYSTPALKVDEKVFNPARISKLYGTLTRKGEDTVTRPHRISRILSAPYERLVPVASAALESLAQSMVPTGPRTTNRSPNPSGTISHAGTGNGNRPTTNGTHRTFSIDEWIAKHIPDAQELSWSGGSRKWLLPVCPLNSEHNRKEAYITEQSSGALAAGCQHESCFKSWRQLREHFEPDAYSRPGNGTASASASRSDRIPVHPEVIYEDDRYVAELEAFADRDRDAVTEKPSEAKSVESTAKWHHAPALVDEIMARANEEWISLTLGPDEICSIRPGGIAVIMGPTGGGKTSLVLGLLIDHATHRGPVIVLSRELPRDELLARAIGIQCDASWADVLRGKVKREFMDQAAPDRMWICDRKNATLASLVSAIVARRDEEPEASILVAIDYAQIIESAEQDVRAKVSDVVLQIDELARAYRVGVLLISQMSRAGSRAARSGEAIGAQTTDGGAESAAIERAATITLTIGSSGPEREDGTAATDLSIGKGRMSGGDRVIPMAYCGRTGRWRVTGEARSAAQVIEERKAEKDSKRDATLGLAITALLERAPAPLSRRSIREEIGGKDLSIRASITALLASPESGVVEVEPSYRGHYEVWSRAKAVSAGKYIRGEAKS